MIPGAFRLVRRSPPRDRRQRHDYFSGKPNGTVQMYINTGTYLPLVQRTLQDGFGVAYRMTMAFFYRGDEDSEGKAGNTPSMEIWNGIRRKVYAG